MKKKLRLIYLLQKTIKIGSKSSFQVRFNFSCFISQFYGLFVVKKKKQLSEMF